MEQESSLWPLIIVAVVFGLPLLLAFISRVRRIRMQRERDAAVAEANELKTKYGPILDVEGHAASILADAQRLRQEADHFAQQTVDAREGILQTSRQEAEQTAANWLPRSAW